MWGAIGISFQGHSRYSNNWSGSELLFKGIVFSFSFYQAQAPALIMDDDGHMIGIVKSRCRL